MQLAEQLANCNAANKLLFTEYAPHNQAGRDCTILHVHECSTG